MEFIQIDQFNLVDIKLSFKDKNDEEWKIAITPTDFMISYFGCEHFKENSFGCDDNGSVVQIENTNCILFEKYDFSVFYTIVNFIVNNYTDDIWEYFEKLLSQQFKPIII